MTTGKSKASTSRQKARKIYQRYYRVKLHKSFHVHHIDFNPFNNQIDNLELLPNGEHIRLHHLNVKHKIQQSQIEAELNELEKLLVVYNDSLGMAYSLPIYSFEIAF